MDPNWFYDVLFQLQYEDKVHKLLLLIDQLGWWACMRCAK